MKILTLIIKGIYFDEIMAGTKTEEFREIKPSTFNKYCEFNPNASEEDGQYTPRHYDAIRFYVGYNKDRKSALVEVLDAEFEYVLDDDGNIVVEEEDGETYEIYDIVYTLGKVLEKNF